LPSSVTAHEQTIICSKTALQRNAHEQTIRPIKTTEKIIWMIILVNRMFLWLQICNTSLLGAICNLFGKFLKAKFLNVPVYVFIFCKKAMASYLNTCRCATTSLSKRENIVAIWLSTEKHQQKVNLLVICEVSYMRPAIVYWGWGFRGYQKRLLFISGMGSEVFSHFFLGRVGIFWIWIMLYSALMLYEMLWS
jgi:hypothetical protein